MIPQGYKQTEIGVIPEEWFCAKIEDIATISMCKRVFADQTTENGDIPFYKIGTFGKEADAYISVALYNEYRNKFSFPEKGDVLISAAGTLGRTVIYDGKDAYFQDSNIVWLDIDKNVLCNEYLNHYYRVIKWASSEGSTIARLYNGIIYATNIALPPLEEQNRIAEALSDVDSMISALEKLIAKKKAIKQGAMQELLTGKKRLSGFAGEWKVYKLDELLKYEQPTKYIVHSAKYTEQGIPVLTAGKSLILGYTTENDGIYENLPVIIFDDFVTSSKYITYRFKVKSSAMKMLTLKKEEMNLKLIFELMQMIDFVPVDHQRHWISQYSQFEIKLPPTIEEQTAIASILSDMDNEIEALEQKLAKTRLVKQGMMQQLLTGKIRLVSANAGNKPIEAVSKLHHNHQFDDAVVIAAIVNDFYTDAIPLGRKKVQKLLYLLRRKQEADTSAFKKKAAGPYADEVRYKGGELIAVRNKYVVKKQGAKGTTFSKGEKIESALEYIAKWEMTDDINWLVSTFKYTKTNDLELFATIDMAMCDLMNLGEVVSVASIKNLIASNKEWKDKLSKRYFSDNNIARAIRFCQSTFN